MTPFHLKIVTPDGLIYDGQAEKLIVRTVGGDVCILARHMDYVAPLGMGRAVVVSGENRRTAACIGGMLSVSAGEVTLVPTTFEWADAIDLDRAERSYQRADKILHDSTATDTDIALAEARLHRALVRKSVVSFK
ncbi:MAG: ATP synthase F1 subunit epsilon [Oscillospiraceae bacterium]|nr:ATP synthase F1 subunit epsilon [Oscillospiraceae bacterium]